jgi:hypothetical protein
MVINRTFILILAACVCFAIALLIALGVSLGGSTFSDWLAGGLLSFALAHLPLGP